MHTSENRHTIEGLNCWLLPRFLSDTEADTIMDSLTEALPWRQDDIYLFGRWVAIPRKQVFMGDAGINYTYSGLDMQAQPWHPHVLQIKNRICELTGYPLNAVLINLYRDGNDHMGWHQDNEKALGEHPVIASVSLGAERRFLFRNVADKQCKHELILNHGSLLWMGRGVQQRWQHSVPKMRRCTTPRINLTFRYFPPTGYTTG